MANNKKYWDQWLVVDVWATLINEELQLPDELKVTGGYLGAWLMESKKYMPIRDLVEVYHNPNKSQYVLHWWLKLVLHNELGLEHDWNSDSPFTNDILMLPNHA